MTSILILASKNNIQPRQIQTDNPIAKSLNFIMFKLNEETEYSSIANYFSREFNLSSIQISKWFTYTIHTNHHLNLIILN